MKSIESKQADNKNVMNDIPFGEYITLEEALKATGLAEKTLRNHLRGTVPSFGRNSWDRKEFFEYWRLAFHERKRNWMDKEKTVRDVLENVL